MAATPGIRSSTTYISMSSGNLTLVKLDKIPGKEIKSYLEMCITKTLISGSVKLHHR